MMNAGSTVIIAYSDMYVMHSNHVASAVLYYKKYFGVIILYKLYIE